MGEGITMSRYGTRKMYECANCAKQYGLDELGVILRYWERVAEEDEVEPDGECPECGALCYEVED